MDRNELKTALRDESSSSLKSLHADFYNSVDLYIRELEGEIKKINNPRSAESKMLEDELQSAITDIEVIFIRRLRKITTRATSNAFSNRSAKSDMDKLLPNERKVYDAVLSAINVARNELIEPIMDPDSVRNNATAQKEQVGAANTDTKIDTKTDIAKDTESGLHKQDVGVSAKLDTASPQGALESTNDSGKSDIAKSNISEEYLVVRILKDLSTFQAVDDRKYTLKEHDVVSLPAVNAKGLVKRKIAQLVQ